MSDPVSLPNQSTPIDSLPPVPPTPPVTTNPPMPPAPPVITPDLSPSLRKKTSNWLLILIIFILLAIIGVLAFQYYQLKIQTASSAPDSSLDLPPTSEQVISPELTAEQDATLDPTATWQTYTNDEYKFSIKYNSDNQPFQDTGPGRQSNLISFGTMKNNGFEIEILPTNKLDYYKNRLLTSSTDNIDNEDEIIVDGVVGTKLTYKQVIVIDEFDVSQVIINNNDFDYLITALAVDIDQIFSTLKFNE